MEALAIAWYVATIMLLAIFAVIVVLMKNKCGQRPPPSSPSSNVHAKPETARPPIPQTPAPAYREFAPPNYDDAIANRIANNSSTSPAVLTPAIFSITILNEHSEQRKEEMPVDIITRTAVTSISPTVSTSSSAA